MLSTTHRPAPSRATRTSGITARTDSLWKAWPERRGQAPEFRQHVGEVFLVAAELHPDLRAASVREHLQPGQQSAHQRVQTVALGELQGEALGQVSREDPGGLEPLQDRQRRRQFGLWDAETACELGRVGAEVAVRLDLADER